MGSAWRIVLLASPGAAWASPGSPVRTHLRSLGYPQPTVVSADMHDMPSYQQAMVQLSEHCEGTVPDQLIIITEGLGLHPVVMAAAFGMRIGRLIDVMGPVEQDLLRIAATGRGNIRTWVHLHPQQAGLLAKAREWANDKIRAYDPHPFADINVGLKVEAGAEVMDTPTVLPVLSYALTAKRPLGEGSFGSIRREHA